MWDNVNTHLARVSFERKFWKSLFSTFSKFTVEKKMTGVEEIPSYT